MGKPLVSVIIPVYNVLPYLREALDSVVAQTYADLEILVIDDGSDDGSGIVCDEYLRDPRVRVVHQENRGLSAARNAGLDLMTGQLVAFLDSDDAYRPDMIRQMVEALERNGADVVVCGHEKYTADRTMTGTKTVYARTHPDRLLTSKEALRRLFDGGIVFAAWDKLYIRRLWEDVRFPEGHVYEDMWTTPLILEKCERILIVNSRLYLHRRRPGSITNTSRIRYFQDWVLARDRLLGYIDAHIPDVFRAGTGSRFEAHTLREMAVRCAEGMARSFPEEVDQWRALRESVLEDSKKAGRIRSLKSLVALEMLRFCPGLLPGARRCYQAFGRLFRKAEPK